MGNKAETLSDAIADGFDSTESTPAEARALRVKQLLMDPKARNPKIWANAGAPVGMRFDVLATLPRAKHSGDTRKALERLIAASMQQADVETITRPLLQVSHKGAVKSEELAKGMDKTEMQEAATAGLVSGKVKEKREARAPQDQSK